jgi:NAD(P)H-flavin reductase
MTETIGEIIEVKEETPDVKTFRLRLTDRIDFIPGQYCLVSIIGNKEFEGYSRPFTFASPPTATGIVELTIKRMGKFTTTLHSLTVGDKLKIDGPNGKSLNFDESIKDDIVFLTGGSGITPFISAIRYAIAKKLPNKMILLFSNRKGGDIIYRKELEEITKNSNIKVIHTLSDEKPDRWSGETGRINRAMIEKYVENPKDKLWYICGPPPMVTAMEKMLAEMGVAKEKSRVEKWQLPGKHDKEEGNEIMP